MEPRPRHSSAILSYHGSKYMSYLTKDDWLTMKNSSTTSLALINCQSEMTDVSLKQHSAAYTAVDLPLLLDQTNSIILFKALARSVLSP